MKKKVIIFATLSVIAVMILLLAIISKSTGIPILKFNTAKIEETGSGFTVKYIDVDTTILTFEYLQGLKSIKCPDGTIISCNGKTKLVMDLKIVPETEYTYEITDINDNKITESFTGKSSYWLTYNLQGGKNQPERQLKINGQTLELSDVMPEAYIYMFKGWSTDPNATDGTYQPGDSFDEDEQVQLYAIWAKNWANITKLKTQANELEEGQHIVYNGTEYVVLYQYKDHETKYTPENGYAEDYGQYGVQLIASDVIKDASGNVEKVTLGGNNYSEAQAAWENWTTIMNTKAEEYILEEDKVYISGRCVGCNPNPNRINETDSYSIDFNQMNKLGISGITSPFPISYDYALAAKTIWYVPTGRYTISNFDERYVSVDGNLQSQNATWSYPTNMWVFGASGFNKKQVGYRPVLIIDPASVGEGDNIDAWLACIGNPNTEGYTFSNINELFANTTLMTDLLNSDEAISYLNKSTEKIIPAMFSNATQFSEIANNSNYISKLLECKAFRYELYKNYNITESILASSTIAQDAMKSSSRFANVSVSSNHRIETTLYSGKAFVLNVSEKGYGQGASFTFGRYINGGATQTFDGLQIISDYGRSATINKFASTVTRKK